MKVIKSLAALVGIVAILVGVPFVLLFLGGNPLAQDIPSIQELLGSPDDGTFLVGFVLPVAGWVAWGFLAVSIVVELFSAIRGVRAPKLPGLSLPQGIARGLVGAALIAFTAAPVANAAAIPSAAAAQNDQPATAVTAPATPGQQASAQSEVRATDPTRGQADQQQRAEAPQGDRTLVHTVAAGDTLWDIAETKLGDGHRYMEIVELNQQQLTSGPGTLTVGMTLRLPADTAPPSDDAADRVTKDVVVERGDTLSQIAQDELGDASKYPEIFEASRNVDQPGGRTLTDPDLILPGWTVQVPDAELASNPDKQERPAGTADSQQSAAASDPQPEHDASERPAQNQDRTADSPTESDDRASSTTTDTQQQADRDTAEESGDTQTSATEATTDATPTQEQQPEPEQVAPTTTTDSAVGQAEQLAPQAQTTNDTPATPDDGMLDEIPWTVVTTAGVGAILAAGVIRLVGRRRSEQQRIRKPGQTIPMPQGEAAAFEQDMRAGANDRAFQTVDTALRNLSHHHTTTQTPLPAVRAARLTATVFELFLEHPTPLPEPWTQTPDNDTVWTIDTTSPIAPADPNATAPYPALVTVGRDDNDDAHIFVNLEHLGALNVTGPDDLTREILAALAIELATSEWADDLQVTLVGAHPELGDAIDTGRLTYVPTLDNILTTLERRIEQDHQALTQHGVPDIRTARATGAAPDAWTPEIILIAGETTPNQHTHLTTLAQHIPNLAIALVARNLDISEWTLEAHRPDRAILQPAGVTLAPQRVAAIAYDHILDVVSQTDPRDVQALAEDVVDEPSVAQVEAITPVDDAAATQTPASGGTPTTAETKAPISDVTSFVLANAPEPTETPDIADVNTPEATETAVPFDTDAPAEALEEHEAADSGDEVHETVEDPMSTSSAPRFLLMGPVVLENPGGQIENGRRARLTELGAFLALNPDATARMIDEAIWPDRETEKNLTTRNSATSKLRRWLGQNTDGEDYLPRHQAGAGYSLHPDVTTDIAVWDSLVRGKPLHASSETLQAALKLVRDLPFQGVLPTRYAWAEPIKQRLISEIVDASYELAKRRLNEGRWRDAEAAIITGQVVEPAQESLWRIRILAAHQSRDPRNEEAAITRLLMLMRTLECELEPETQQLLEALKHPGAGFDRLMATAL